ncbi:hypothetical protein [Flavobacterium kingsejongi]|uniref:Uncharacterized protein n=1 Tax=Flavobacterium kingsejongi TaxID=1678728 RepID=A0A2S1LMX8_9FLAO|nr:hypothetical protein [Flavobacterium kingsejongi]AWG24816.1 hypothetical protein FK004_06025 [Flavobacterium kingsejongi]AWG25038.1 hypothetical protein FK004_07230 [Flavobacterium kingsejongi]
MDDNKTAYEIWVEHKESMRKMEKRHRKEKWFLIIATIVILSAPVGVLVQIPVILITPFRFKVST